MLAADGTTSSSKVEAAWEQIKALAHTTLVPMSSGQMEALETLQETVLGWPGKVAAVSSSAAPEEDGEGAAFAGIFAETELGVSSESLEGAVRKYFASSFDRRALSYRSSRIQTLNEMQLDFDFAIVVMEMVDTIKAGVALFSANPLNSDLDEMVVDASSWGLRESVLVDGSIARV